MVAGCPRWGGGPSVVERKVRGSGTVGRNPGVQPVLEPVLARRSVGGSGERFRSGPRVEGGDEAVLVVILGAEVPVPGWGDEVAEMVEEDMLREARKGARGEKSRGGYTRLVKGGWLATSIVTREAVAEIR